MEKVARIIEPEREPDGGKFCCLTSIKLVKGVAAAGSDGPDLTATLILAENDDHVKSKSPK